MTAVKPSGLLVRFIIVLVAATAVYVATFSFRPTTDTQLNSLQTRALSIHGDVDLSRYQPRGGFYVERGSATYSIYGVGISAVSFPFYAPLLRLGAGENVLQGTVSCVAAGLAVAFMFTLLTRLFPVRLAIAGTICFGFGTTMLPVASTALWQHAPVVLFDVLGLLAVTSPRRSAPFLAGLAFGAAAFVRLPAALPLAAFLIYYVTRNVRSGISFIGGITPFVVARIVENVWLWGSPLRTGYSYEPQTFAFRHFLTGLLGEVFSWRRGLFTYSPVFVIALFGIALSGLAFRRAPEERHIFYSGVAFIGLLVVNATHVVWWGGERQFGYRYLIDAIPFLILPVVWSVKRVRSLGLPFSFLGALSIVFMAAGSVPQRDAWDTTFPQDQLSLSPLSHALRGTMRDPFPFVWRIFLIGALAAVMLRLFRNPEGESHSPSVVC